MKLFALILSYLFCLNAFSAPMGVSGLNQTNKYPSVIKVPNNLATDIGSSSSLLEIGNNNILANPSFEAATFGTIWINSAGATALDTSTVIHGKKALKVTLSSQALDTNQDSTLYASQFADGVQGLAYLRVKTTISTTPIYVCPRTAGSYPSQKTSGCVQVQANGKWGLYKVPFLLGATSNGIGITSNGVAITGDVYIDDAFVGAVDLKQDVDQSRIAGASYFAGAASCTWARTNTAIGPFTATTACPGPSIEDGSMGLWQTTDSDLPRQTINNLPAGKYEATFYVSQYNTASSLSSMAISDGTTVCKEVAATAGSSQGSVAVSCIFNYTSSGNRSFELYGASGISTITIDNRNASSINSQTKFILKYFGSGSVYSSTNADTDWDVCNFSTLAWNGLGTVTPSLYCKREGANLVMQGRVLLGTVAASEARIPLPLWNGSQLSLSSTKLASGLTNLAPWGRSASSGSHGGFVLATPSNQYLQLSAASVFGSTASSGLASETGANVASTGETISFYVSVPIDGWQNSNIIIGQFNGLESCADSYQCTDTFSAKVSSAGVVSAENLEWITGDASGTNPYALTFKTGLFTTTPNCWGIVSDSTSAVVARATATTSASVSMTMFTVGTTPAVTTENFRVFCQKTGADAVFKTARAVSSDQNVATPGVLKAELFSATFGTTNATTVCSASPCSYLDTMGSGISSVTRASTGNYVLNFSKTYTKVKCQFSGNNSSGYATVVTNGPTSCSNCSTLAFQQWGLSPTPAIGDAFGSISCHGYAP